MIEDAMKGAPALFASPGDVFFTRDRNSWGDSYVEYVGRNEVVSNGTSPKKGWLIFHNSGHLTPLNVTNGGIRDTLGAWPMQKYSHYTEDGEMIEQTLCIPPEMCGALILAEKYDDDGNEIQPQDVCERMKDMTISKKMLQEAKRAVPALVAKKGDLFEWRGWYEPVVVEYVGRNKLPPLKVRSRGAEYWYSPEIGWPIFRNPRGHGNGIDVTNGGIRDGIGAWPMDAYSHYSCKKLKEATSLFELALWKCKIDQTGADVDREACRVEVPGPVKDTIIQYLGRNRITGTLCIPPEMCGHLNVYTPPKYDDW